MIPYVEALKEHRLKDDIDFLLSHLDQDVLFPRKMMTKQHNYQFTINSKDQIIEKCISSDLVDCRINAYPESVPYTDFTNQAPNFIFIDLDLSNFAKFKNPKKMLDKTLRNTLNKISESFFLEPSQHTQHTQHTPTQRGYDIRQQQLEFAKEVKPTVLWSGNGYHIYLPIEALVLDDFDPFSKDKFPNLFSTYYGKYSGYSVSEVFLLFSIQYLTNGKADPQHRPKYKTCLIRIPNTHNSKCLDKGSSPAESKVKVVQEWNGYRPPIQLLTKEFRRWLVQEEIQQRIKVRRFEKDQITNTRESPNFQVRWIEKLLQAGISDGRKETLRLILGPYLAKRKNSDATLRILQEWLDKCHKLNPLDSDFNPRQRSQNAMRNPHGFTNLMNLKVKYRWLYNAININNVN
jgi:hypothetical protein